MWLYRQVFQQLRSKFLFPLKSKHSNSQSYTARGRRAQPGQLFPCSLERLPPRSCPRAAPAAASEHRGAPAALGLHAYTGPWISRNRYMMSIHRCLVHLLF